VLIAAGVVTLPLHPFFPMSSRWMESGFNDTMHGTLTFVWGPIIFVAVALSAAAYRGWFRIYAIASLAAMIVFGIASGIAIQGIEQNDTPWAGAFERVNAYVLAAWFVVLAVTVMRRSRDQITYEEGVIDAPRTRPLPKGPAFAAKA
jgi:uncharacterized protein DUF998